MRRSVLLLNLVVSAAVIGLVACGSSDDSTFNGNQNGDGGALGDGSGIGLGGGGDDGGGTIDGKPVASLTIDPPTATLDVSNTPYPTKQFTMTAHFTDGTSEVASATWSSSNAPVGSINGSGLYATRGGQGGPVTITASAAGKTATATLTVTLHQISNPAGVDAATQASLLAATGAAGSVVWTYPYDGMAYPRGIDAPNMMWNGATAGDIYAIHIVSPTYELQEFTIATFPAITTAGTAPGGATSFAFDAAEWTSFVDSTSGPATVTVTRKSGTTYTKLISQTWNIANKSMSGSIYYWAINKGVVLRIKPGESAPVNFLNAPATASTPPATGTPGLYCPSCHTASADGTTLVMGTGPWGSSGGKTDTWSSVYDLAGASPVAGFNGYETGTPASDLPLSAVSANGKVIVENWATVRGSAMGKTDSPLAYAATSGTSLTPITTSGLETLVGAGVHTYFPVFSADNAYFAYVDSSTAILYGATWDPVAMKFSSRVKLADAPTDGTKIAYPTISPDHRWVVYQVDPDSLYGSLNINSTGDLYAVDTLNPNHPISLAGINASMSAAQTAVRDEHRSYEPTFAPVASGGYFWLVFHSRRTYGNALVDVAYGGVEGSGTKQLWVAAINVPAATSSATDPSHPPFWLPGQDIATRNMRGYWALDPCEADGATCSSGTDCCNGFCDTTNDAGAAVCGSTSSGCSEVGDKCNVTSDCCNATSGVTCINHSCSEVAPR